MLLFSMVKHGKYFQLIIVFIFSIYVFETALALNEEDERIMDFESFDEYRRYINKSYLHTYDEFRSRLAFEENRDAVRLHNQRFRSGESSYRLRTNVMADMSNDSYLKNFLRLLRSKRFEAVDMDSESVGSPLMRQTPAAIDWREKGFITRPDNQQTCGSCYAFSIAESIEGQVFKRTGRILNLSPQQIVDCSVSHGNQGCTGGSLRNTLKYLQSTGGIMRSKDYKYVSKYLASVDGWISTLDYKQNGCWFDSPDCNIQKIEDQINTTHSVPKRFSSFGITQPITL